MAACAVGGGTAFFGHDLVRQLDGDGPDISDDGDSESTDDGDEGASVHVHVAAQRSRPATKTHTAKKRHWPRRPRGRANDIDEGRWHRMMAAYSGGTGGTKYCCQKQCLRHSC